MIQTGVEPSPMTERAMFGAGCFWGVEYAFRQVPGVVDVAVGYSGGTTENPTYREVCTGLTGHAEVVEIEFDPEQVSYQSLLEVLWDIHDPTTLNRQGPDRGTQYRSGIYTYSEAQQELATASKERAGALFSRPVVTEIVPAKPFYRAEEYHQQYFEKSAGPKTCGTFQPGPRV